MNTSTRTNVNPLVVNFIQPTAKKTAPTMTIVYDGKTEIPMFLGGGPTPQKPTRCDDRGSAKTTQDYWPDGSERPSTHTDCERYTDD